MHPSPDRSKALGSTLVVLTVDDMLPVAPTGTLAKRKISAARRHALLVIFCLAQFLDAFNNSSIFPAIPSLVNSLRMTESESTWVVSAFQLTFASFLLVSGRISDIYNPKTVFITGLTFFGIVSIVTVFAQNKIIFIVLRGLVGIAASLTVPSTMALLINVFTEPSEQARAIGVLGGCGAIGDALGLVIGGIFVQYTSWHWIFWFLAMVALSMALVCTLLVPPAVKTVDNSSWSTSKFQQLDVVGVSLLTVTLILLIFALTFGPTEGWRSAKIIAPFIISICSACCFFLWELRIPANQAAVPPQTWFYPNFTILFAVALVPFFWWTAMFLIFTTLWQDVYHWTAISAAMHMLPIGLSAFATSWTGILAKIFNAKWLIITGQFFLMAATLLLVFADGPDKYWPLVFPAFVIGSTGAILIYTHANIAIFQTTPPSMAGTVSAVFNGALQLGSAVGLAAVTAIETSEEGSRGGFYQYHSRVVVFWFVLGVLAMQTTCTFVFYHGQILRDSPESNGILESLD